MLNSQIWNEPFSKRPWIHVFCQKQAKKRFFNKSERLLSEMLCDWTNRTEVMAVYTCTCTVHTVYLYPHNAHLSLSTKSSGCGPVMSCSSEAPFACAGSTSVLTGSFHCGFHWVASFLWPSVETRYWLGNFFHCITSGITSCTHSSDNGSVTNFYGIRKYFCLQNVLIENLNISTKDEATKQVSIKIACTVHGLVREETGVLCTRFLSVF